MHAKFDDLLRAQQAKINADTLPPLPCPACGKRLWVFWGRRSGRWIAKHDFYGWLPDGSICPRYWHRWEGAMTQAEFWAKLPELDSIAPPVVDPKALRKVVRDIVRAEETRKKIAKQQDERSRS